MTEKTFTRGSILFSEGDPGTEAYLIRSGHVTVWRMEGDHKVVLATRAEGEIVGEMALLDDTARSASVTAESDVNAEVITKVDLDSLVENVPEPLQLILHQIFESLRTANDIIGMYASRPSSE